MQLNLQHSRIVTNNITKLIEQDNSDIIFINEPFLYQNKMAVLTKSHQNYISQEDKSWAAILITNNKIDAVLVTQLSNPDSVILELRYNNTRFFAASMYFTIMKETERELDKIDQITGFTKGNGLVIAIDSNSRSTAWQNIQTNKRGKIIEEDIYKQKSLYYE
jgi:hypothetical protein